MFCLLPPTRLALGLLWMRVACLTPAGSFNLMRNLGGAIGLALIDTVIYTRSPVHSAAIMDRLRADDIDTAKFVGIPLDRARGPGRLFLDAATQGMLRGACRKGQR